MPPQIEEHAGKISAGGTGIDKFSVERWKTGSVMAKSFIERDTTFQFRGHIICSAGKFAGTQIKRDQAQAALDREACLSQIGQLLIENDKIVGPQAAGF